MNIENRWERLSHHLREYSHDAGAVACNKRDAAKQILLEVMREAFWAQATGHEARAALLARIEDLP